MHSYGLHVCLFFPLKVHHPPLESSESHAGGAALKVCQRGEAPGARPKSPIASQSPEQMTGPVRSSGGAEPKRGQEPTAVHTPHRYGFTGKPACRLPAHCCCCSNCLQIVTKNVTMQMLFYSIKKYTDSCKQSSTLLQISELFQ